MRSAIRSLPQRGQRMHVTKMIRQFSTNICRAKRVAPANWTGCSKSRRKKEQNHSTESGEIARSTWQSSLPQIRRRSRSFMNWSRTSLSPKRSVSLTVAAMRSLTLVFPRDGRDNTESSSIRTKLRRVLATTKSTNHGMQRSGGGAVLGGINVNSRRPLIPVVMGNPRLNR